MSEGYTRVQPAGGRQVYCAGHLKPEMGQLDHLISVYLTAFIFNTRKLGWVIIMARVFDKNKRFGTRDPEECERLIKLLNDRAKELGRKPKKEDMTGKEVGAIKKCFGKWCYALEASGLQIPSEKTLERREAKTRKWDRKHKAAKERRKLRNKVPGVTQPDK